MKMAANFAFRTGNKKRKLFAYGRNLWFPRYSRICYHVYAMLSYVYTDFCKKGSVKTTKYGVFACSDVLYVEQSTHYFYSLEKSRKVDQTIRVDEG